MMTGLYWFTQDLRLDDNPALQQAAQTCDRLLCVYVDDTRLERPGHFNSSRRSARRRQFLHQGLADLHQQLKALGHSLQILKGDPVAALTGLIASLDIRNLYLARQVGWDEYQQLKRLRSRFPQLQIHLQDSYTLYSQAQISPLPAPFPHSFSKFRGKVEPLAVAAPLPAVKQLPPPPELPEHLPCQPFSAPAAPRLDPGWFPGGELAARAHVQRYFASPLPCHYKAVRNELDGLDNGTRFSPWLAQGSLSPRRVMQQLQDYEARQGANESTYWIFFELLWREFFQWYARHYGSRLFHLRGIRQHPTLTSFYPQRFKAWCEGTTQWPLVNACMRQLKQTGWISNRARQIVASCLVNELELDWRYGAAWFEQELLDYDVGSNWGNWQYLAGVGADPRGKRRFDIAKQTKLYDPEGEFIRRWRGAETGTPLHGVDAADWPIMPGH